MGYIDTQFYNSLLNSFQENEGRCKNDEDERQL